VGELTVHADGQRPGERVPCLIFLDEAGYWLPQRRVQYLEKDTLGSLRDTFRTLATTGRKRGLLPVVLTQRISEIDKSVIAQMGVRVLMRAALKNDLDAYMSYIGKTSGISSEDIAAFTRGQAVVCLPGGTQIVTTFNERESEHISHTPQAAAAMQKFGGMPFHPTQQFTQAVVTLPTFTRYELAVLDVLREKVPQGESVTARDVMLKGSTLLRTTGTPAVRAILEKFFTDGTLAREGAGKSARYCLKSIQAAPTRGFGQGAFFMLISCVRYTGNALSKS
jgi:hypothetical protein